MGKKRCWPNTATYYHVNRKQNMVKMGCSFYTVVKP